MTQTKIVWKFLTAVVLLLAVRVAVAGSIMGSKHDFTMNSWSGGQICIACHNFSSSNPSVASAPGWDHTMNSAQVYTQYTSTRRAMGASALPAQTPIGLPGERSKLCLSCHDGTIAVDSFGGGSNGTQYVSDANKIGTDLRDDHPIGLQYSVADATLYSPDTLITIGSGSTRLNGKISDLMLFSGVMECSSCHDVHNKYTIGATGLMKIASAKDAICVTCHKK
jgi:hypothetical protein